MTPRRTGRWLSGWLFASLILLVQANILGAQIVRGKVVERDKVTPARGVIVALIDSGRKTVLRTISRETGFFAMRAPSEGRYRLQILRVGYKSVTTPEFLIPSDSIVERNVVFDGAPISLRTVNVAGRERCRLPKDVGAAAFELWEEIGKALTTSWIAQREGRVQMQLRAFRGELREKDSVTTVVQVVDVSGLFGRPFGSIPVDSLQQFGYIRAGGDGRLKMSVVAAQAFGPDEEVLLSDQFAATHCFKAVANSKSPDLIGLQFSPIEKRKGIADVEGTLWVDRESAALRYLEFHYTNPLYPGDWKRAGGRLQFTQLPNGMWVIPEWEIRMPHPTTKGSLEVSGGMLAELRAAPPDTDVVVWLRHSHRLSGIVIDSTDGKPIRNAIVRTMGETMITDDDGRFEMNFDVPGRYVFDNLVPLFDSIAVERQWTGLVLTANPPEITLKGISEANYLKQQCRDRWNSDSAGVLVGFVVSRYERLAGARVTAAWPDSGATTDSLLAAGKLNQLTTKSRGDAQFLLCGIPRGVPFIAFAEAEGRRSELFRGRFDNRLYVMQRFVIPSGATSQGKKD
jgi:hypothetical protein